ncbi:MAG TPA: hypothetical protein PLK63_01430 [Catalimonadaceae bacterium]|nr:hypothetical protein [Catalimonadaceae bacterium]
MQYLFISIFVLSNLLNFSMQMESAKGESRGFTIRKQASSGMAIASVEFFLEETEDNKEQEEHDSPEIQGGALQGQLTGFTHKVVQILGSGQDGGESNLFIYKKLFLFLHNMRI